MKNMIPVCLLLFFLSNLPADEPPLHMTQFKSQDGKYILNLINTTNTKDYFLEEWELISAGTNEPVYRLDCRQFSLSPLEVIISGDGEHIILVNWFLGVDWQRENRRTILNKTVLRFYSRGQITREYMLSDVFGNIRKGIRSASHLQWTGFNRDKSDVRLENNSLVIKTLESNEYIFDIKTGEIVSVRKTRK